jgi:flavin reductase (DIM6/NTAB) family NADH-FMN oxidoreductase RutF
MIQNFKEALRTFASGVVVLMLKTPSGVDGITMSSFTSISLTPPLVGVYLGQKARLYAAIQQARHFSVNILTHTQQLLADQGANGGFLTISPVVAWDNDIPYLPNSAATLFCHKYNQLPIGDHDLLALEVDAVQLGAPASPLLYYQREYHTLGA